VHLPHILHRRPLIAIIAILILLVAGVDFWTPADLIEAILFTIPLVLCATQRSRRLLWSAAIAAVLLTAAAQLWGVAGVDPPRAWIS
jgi:hypothetical protein